MPGGHEDDDAIVLRGEGPSNPREESQGLPGNQIKMLSRDREITHWRIVGTPQNQVPIVSLGRHWNSCQTSMLSYLGFGNLRAIVSSSQREVSQFLSRSKS